MPVPAKALTLINEEDSSLIIAIDKISSLMFILESTIKALLGHENIQTTLIYARSDEENVIKAMV